MRTIELLLVDTVDASLWNLFVGGEAGISY